MLALKCSQCGAKESPITQDIISLFVEVKDIDKDNWKCSTCFREEVLATKEETSDQMFIEADRYKEEREHLESL